MKVKCPGTCVDLPEDLAEQSRVRSRHETLNGWFKCWEILKQTFATISQIMVLICDIAVVIQLSIDEGQKLFSVAEYIDN